MPCRLAGVHLQPIAKTKSNLPRETVRFLLEGNKRNCDRSKPGDRKKIPRPGLTLASNWFAARIITFNAVGHSGVDDRSQVNESSTELYKFVRPCDRSVVSLLVCCIHLLRTLR